MESTIVVDWSLQADHTGQPCVSDLFYLLLNRKPLLSRERTVVFCTVTNYPQVDDPSQLQILAISAEIKWLPDHSLVWVEQSIQCRPLIRSSHSGLCEWGMCFQRNVDWCLWHVTSIVHSLQLVSCWTAWFLPCLGQHAVPTNYGRLWQVWASIRGLPMCCCLGQELGNVCILMTYFCSGHQPNRANFSLGMRENTIQSSNTLK